MPSSRPLPVVLVLGMHRSGTSALARVVNLLGADIGVDLLPGRPDNPAGFWENPGLMDLHERLLVHLGASGWDDVRPLPARWWEASDTRPFGEELGQLLRESYDANRPWVVKDPRLCRLLPLWPPALDALGRRGAVVLSLRHPASIAHSLARRDGMAPNVAYTLWLRHVLEAERHSRDIRRVLIDYDAFLEDWQGQVRRMARSLHLTWPHPIDSVAEDVGQFLDPDLRHHHTRPEDGDDDAERVGWILETHAALEKLARRSDAAAKRRLDAIGADLDGVDWLLEPPPTHQRDPDATVSPWAAVERWDHGQLDAQRTLDELLPDRPVSFSIQPRHANFCRLDLMVGTYNRTNTATLVVEVFDENDAPLARVPVSTADLVDNAWCTFRFRPDPTSRMLPRRITVGSPDAEPGNTVSLYARSGGEPVYRAYYASMIALERDTTLPAPALTALAAVEARVDGLGRQLAAQNSQFEQARRRDAERTAALSSAMTALGDRLAAVDPTDRIETLAEQLQQFGSLSGDDILQRCLSEVAGSRQQLEAAIAALAADVGERLGACNQRLADVTRTGDETRRLAAGAEVQLGEHARRVASLREEITRRDEELRTGFAALEPRLTELNRRTEGYVSTIKGFARHIEELDQRLAGTIQQLDTQQREVRDDRTEQTAALSAMQARLTAAAGDVAGVREHLRAVRGEIVADLAATISRLDDVERQARRVEARSDAGFEIIREALEEDAAV